MAYEICSQSLRTVGVSCGGVSQADVIAAAKSSSAVAGCFSSRKSWSPPATHVGFGGKKTLRQEGFERRPELARQTSLRATVRVDRAEHLNKSGYLEHLNKSGYLGDGGSPEEPSDHQSAGPGSSALERWLEGYLTEIVRHLPEAPFLQLVPKYTNYLQGERRRVPEELFQKPENWQSVSQCLLDASPDGMILVHRLDLESLSECSMNDVDGAEEASSSSTASLQAEGSSADVWGVLVHGCKTRCNACYILKTTQVASSSGILTHFCVSRAKCFGPSLKSQLQRAWLL